MEISPPPSQARHGPSLLLSVIHGIKRKPHLSVVWNWYHFVAIAILHQPRPADSADINTRLQLSDTSSIPPMHGGFLLIYVIYLISMLHQDLTLALHHIVDLSYCYPFPSKIIVDCISRSRGTFICRST